MPQNFLSSSEFSGFTHYLRCALPYLEEFHQHVFVIQLSGDVLQEAHTRILEDILLLRRVGIRIIIVHGAQAQILQILKDHGMSPCFNAGRIVAEKKVMHLIQQAIASLNWKLLGQLQGSTGGTIPFSGHFIQATAKKFADPVPEHWNGVVQKLNVSMLQQSLNQGQLPVIPPFSLDDKGQLLLLDPNEVVKEVAVRLRSKKMIVLINSPELEAVQGKTTYQMSSKETIQWMEKNPELSDSLTSTLNTLVEACNRGVERCHLLNSKIEGGLLAELLTAAGVGTMITNTSYQKIRTAKLCDIPEIMRLLEKPVRESLLIHRSAGYVENNIEQFLVFCIDEELVGYCEMIPFLKEHSVEIACLTVDPAYRNQGIARALVLAVIDLAKKHLQKQVFALSKSNSHLFLQCGFKHTPLEHLPQEKAQAYDSSESRVYGIIL